jgi:hypothetical protein
MIDPPSTKTSKSRGWVEYLILFPKLVIGDVAKNLNRVDSFSFLHFMNKYFENYSKGVPV